MFGSVRLRLSSLAWAVFLAALVPVWVRADPPAGAQAAGRAGGDGAALYGLPGEDPPQAFVPLHPRTVDDRRQIDALRDFTAARALEDQHNLRDAVALLEQALKLEPDSVSILRRLSRLSFQDRKFDRMLEYGRRVLEVDPGDSDTIDRLVRHYLKNKDLVGAETMLKGVVDNPKLGAHAGGRLVAEFRLGEVSLKLGRTAQAADAYAKVLEGLDEKDANRLSPREQTLIFGDEPAETYLEFGKVFRDQKRYDLAVRAFERGLVYDEEHPQLPLDLAETLLLTGKGTEALTLVEHFLKRQPQGSEGYELLAKILTALKRENEITPRLEEAARIDSKNLPLQYALADRYRETGQGEKADALYKALVAQQPTPQGYTALAASLLKRKKVDELLKLFVEVRMKTGGIEPIKAQLSAVVEDPELCRGMLDAGMKFLSAQPPQIDRSAVDVLAFIATTSSQVDKLVPILRVVLKQDPSAQLYREVAHAEELVHKYADAAATIDELLEKYPGERDARTLTVLGEYRRLAGKYDASVAALREALKLEPNNDGAQFVLGWSLVMGGKVEEGFDLFKSVLKNDPANPRINSLYGHLLLQFGRNEEAIALYKSILERFGNNEDLVRTARSGMSVAYVNLGDYVKGEAELEILYQANPDEPGVNNDLGYLYADQGKKLDKAETMVRKALAQDPDNSAYLDSLGWVLFKQGNAKEAIEPLEKAVKHLTGGGDATIHEHLGDVYFRLQETAKAKAAWTEAEKAAAQAIPSDKRLGEIRKKLQSLDKLAPSAKPASPDTP